MKQYLKNLILLFSKSHATLWGGDTVLSTSMLCGMGRSVGIPIFIALANLIDLFFLLVCDEPDHCYRAAKAYKQISASYGQNIGIAKHVYLLYIKTNKSESLKDEPRA